MGSGGFSSESSKDTMAYGVTSKTGMKNKMGLSKLCRYVKLVWVCQTEVGISNVYRNVILIQECYTNTGMSNLPIRIWQYYMSMSNWSGNFKLIQECHTNMGLSYLYGYIELHGSDVLL